MASEHEEFSNDLKEVPDDIVPDAMPGLGAAKNVVKLNFPEREEALKHLSRERFKCPVGICERFLTGSELLAHGIYEHAQDFRFHKAHAGMPVLFECNTSEFVSGEDKCLGVIGYTGITKSSMDNKDHQPSGRLICLPNQGLRDQYEACNLLFPVYVMGCKTNWIDALLPKGQRKFSVAVDRSLQEIMVFCLTGASALKNIHASVTAFNEKRTASIGSLVEIRESPSPGLKDIMAKANQHLILRKPEQKTMVEVVIQELDPKFRDECI